MSARRPSGPLLLQAGVAVLIALVVAAVALVPAPTSPPATAAIGPDAAKQIAEAPESQQGEAGGPGGANADATTTTSTSVTPSTDPRAGATTPSGQPPAGARVRRCVPNGDGTSRQTEDPTSPPCVAFSASTPANNGGATTKGVSADTIRIAVPTSPIWDPPIVAAYQAYFNDRYELHGRKLELVAFKNPQPITEGPGAFVTAAVKLDEELKVFASTGIFSAFGTAEQVFYDELARRKILSIEAKTTTATTADLRRNAPYEWQYGLAYDELLATTGEWYCASLAGRSPRFAGALFRTRPARTVAVVHQPRHDGAPADLRPFTQKLAACGTDVVEVAVPSTEGAGQGAKVAASPAVRQAIADLARRGITTVFAATNSVSLSQLQSAADQQAYQPEWLSPTLYGFSSRGFGIWLSPGQLGRTFGIDVGDPELAPADDPAAMAALEGGATDLSGNLRPSVFYRTLLMLATGIQGAGPNLTPETFGAALRRATFPAAGRTGTRTPTPRIGFGAQRLTMVRDVAVSWFDVDGSNPETGATPTVCSIGGHRRFAAGGFLRDESGLYDPAGCP